MKTVTPRSPLDRVPRSARTIRRARPLVILLLLLPLVAPIGCTARGVVRGGETTGSGEVPFRTQAHLVTVDVELPPVGVRTFVVDTGAQLTVLNERTARELDLSSAGTVAVRTADDVSRRRPVVRVPVMRAGPVEWTGFGAIVMDLSWIETQLDARIDGILGTNALRRFDVEFDHDRGRLALRSPGGAFAHPDADRAIVTALRRDAASPMVRMRVGDAPPVWATLDTGARSTSLPRRLAAARLAEEPWRASIGAYGLGLFGDPTPALRLDDARVRIGGVDVGPAPIVTIESSTPLVGQQLLARHLLRIEYQRARAILVPRSESALRAEPLALAGEIAVLRDADGRLVIAGVWSGGAAESAGLRRLDRVVSIDGEPVAGRSVDEVNERLGRARSLPLTLEVERDGERVRVVVPAARSEPTTTSAGRATERALPRAA